MTISFDLIDKDWESKFWKRVKPLSIDGSYDPNVCWFWNGALNHKGYGTISYNRRGIYLKMQAHRYSAYLAGLLIQEDLLVCHKCDNKWCVNPNHLFVGTEGDNRDDYRLKGFRRRPPKLSIEAVKDIKWHLENNYYRGLTKELAKKHGVSTALILRIKCRREYGHIRP
jgi:hypothetical protein